MHHKLTCTYDVLTVLTHSLGLIPSPAEQCFNISTLGFCLAPCLINRSQYTNRIQSMWSSLGFFLHVNIQNSIITKSLVRIFLRYALLLYFAPADLESITRLTNMVPICLSNTLSLIHDSFNGTSAFVIVALTDQYGSGWNP
jgi:hypothetical protein